MITEAQRSLAIMMDQVELLFLRIVGIHLIFNEILDYLPISDVFSWSCVSRICLLKCREYLQGRRTIYMKILRVQGACLKLQELNELVETSTLTAPVPINAIRKPRLLVTHFTAWSPRRTGLYSCTYCDISDDVNSIRQVYPALFRNLRPLKEIELTATGNKFNHCRRWLQFYQEATLDNWENIEVIDWGDRAFEDKNDTFVINDPELLRIKTTLFPNLKTIVATKSTLVMPKSVWFGILEACPSVKQISGCVHFSLLDPSVEPKTYSDKYYSLFRTFMVDFHSYRPEDFPCLANTPLKLSNLELMDLDDYHERTWDPQLSQLVNNSQQTLRIISCSIGQLIFFTQHDNNLVPLPNIRTLNIAWAQHVCMFPKVLELLSSFNLYSVFPGFEIISLVRSWCGFSMDPTYEIPEYVKRDFSYPSVCIAYINWLPMESGNLERFIQIFPRVRDFKIDCISWQSLGTLGSLQNWNLYSLELVDTPNYSLNWINILLNVKPGLKKLLVNFQRHMCGCLSNGQKYLEVKSRKELNEFLPNYAGVQIWKTFPNLQVQIYAYFGFDRCLHLKELHRILRDLEPVVTTVNMINIPRSQRITMNLAMTFKFSLM